MPPTFRSSRSGRQFADTNANRTRTGQIDHDVFEGLPVRRWTRQPHTFSQASRAEDLDTVSQSTGGSQSLPELPMPKDSQLLAPASKALLRAARAGCIYIRRVNKEGEDDEKETTDIEESAAPPKTERSFTARKWAVVPKHLEPPEVEFLAKRRPGLPSLYGATAGVTESALIGAAPPMRKTKFQKVDPVTGNISVYEAWVPEGHKIEGEITDDAPIIPEKTDAAVIPEAPAPGTVVEGVGVVNAEGVVVAEAGSAAVMTPPKKRPPPPKRKWKGIGRGRRKRVMFAHGDDTGPGAARAGLPSAGVDGQTEGAMDVDMTKEEDGDASRISVDQSGQDEDEEEGDEGDDSDDGDDLAADAKTPDATAQDAAEDIAEPVKTPMSEVIGGSAAELVTEPTTASGADAAPSGFDAAALEHISTAVAPTTREATIEDIAASKVDLVSEVHLTTDKTTPVPAVESVMGADQPSEHHESETVEGAPALASQDNKELSPYSAVITSRAIDSEPHPSTTGDASSRDVDMMADVSESERHDAPEDTGEDLTMRDAAANDSVPSETTMKEAALRSGPDSAADDQILPDSTRPDETNEIPEQAEKEGSAGTIPEERIEQSSDPAAEPTESGDADLLDSLEASLGAPASEPVSQSAVDELQLPSDTAQAAAPDLEENTTEQASVESGAAGEPQPENTGRNTPQPDEASHIENVTEATQPEQQPTQTNADADADVKTQISTKAPSTAPGNIEAKDTASANDQPTTATQRSSAPVYIPATALGAAPPSSPGPIPFADDADEGDEEAKENQGAAPAGEHE